VAVVAVIIVVYSMLGNDSSGETIPSGGKVLLETSMGNITIQLRDDMPITTENFKNLVQKGVYDDITFHRVKADFMIQSGDPTGTGFGDPSIPNIQDEFSENPENNKNKRGTIAMANTGVPNSGSSQFFINVVYNSHLDNLHPVFGEVITGMDVVDRISEVSTDGDPPDGNNRPLEDVTLIESQLID
jgi:peptidylprolyl isomerase